ncbi:MAG TPA: hypothetical protein VGI76_00205, partial [Solirubrobacteraceae bacterium]
LTMPTEFTAQNGIVLKQSTKIAVSGCKKPLTRAQKLAKAMKACHRKHGKRRRSCEARARKAFGAKVKKGGRRKRG